MTFGGHGYTNAPRVRVIGTAGSGAEAEAVISNKVVTGIRIVSSGLGYTNEPVIVVDPPVIPEPRLEAQTMSSLTFRDLSIGKSYKLQSLSGGLVTEGPLLHMIHIN